MEPPQPGVKCGEWHDFVISKGNTAPENYAKISSIRQYNTNPPCVNMTDADTIPSTIRNCHSLFDMKFLHESEFRGMYALYSFPGSGNTWVRLLIEELSGIFTGSIYHDTRLVQTGMLGEGVKTEHAIVVKCHRIVDEPFGAIIAIVRNPFHAIISKLALTSTHAHNVEYFTGVWCVLYCMCVCEHVCACPLAIYIHMLNNCMYPHN